MNETGFTKGPWRILPEECDKDYIRIRGTQLGCRYKIANVITPTYEGVPHLEAVETRTNAQLIAAAPEMYEALQSLVDSGIDNMAMHNTVVDLLAKVRGAQ